MKTKELADRIGYGRSTVRKWTSQEYQEYLSPTGQGGSGRNRNFTEQDARVIALVATMKSEGVKSNEIHITLKQMQLENWVNLPEMPPAPPGVGPIEMVPLEAAEARARARNAELTLSVNQLSDRVQFLEKELEKHEGKNEELQAQYVEAKEQLGQLQGQLNERQPATWWLKVIGLVALLVVAVSLLMMWLILTSAGGLG